MIIVAVIFILGIIVRFCLFKLSSSNQKISLVDSNGVSTNSKVTVVTENTGKMKFDSNTYSCVAGTSIATVENSANQVKCAGCLVVDIKCVNTGRTSLYAKTSSGAFVSVSITVK